MAKLFLTSKRMPVSFNEERAGSLPASETAPQSLSWTKHKSAGRLCNVKSNLSPPIQRHNMSARKV